MTPASAPLRIEHRPGGALLLTDSGGGRWGFGVAGFAAGAWLLAAALGGDVSVLGSVVLLPLALIALLTGVAAVRHRDWILLDRGAREIVFRRGLAAIFRPVSTVPFDEVEAIAVHPVAASPGLVEITLIREGDFTWPLAMSGDSAYVSRLLAALHEVGGWPVLEDGMPLRAPFRVSVGGG